MTLAHQTAQLLLAKRVHYTPLSCGGWESANVHLQILPWSCAKLLTHGKSWRCGEGQRDLRFLWWLWEAWLCALGWESWYHRTIDCPGLDGTSKIIQFQPLPWAWLPTARSRTTSGYPGHHPAWPCVMQKAVHQSQCSYFTYAFSSFCRLISLWVTNASENIVCVGHPKALEVDGVFRRKRKITFFFFFSRCNNNKTQILLLRWLIFMVEK